jgi:dTDP-4-amino-4,6-dideoxygalactose transaminase
MHGDSSAPIPLVDLAWQHAQIAEEIAPALERVMAAGSFIHGADVTDFEREFASACGTRHCVGVANGTDALELALRAAGLRDGDGVVIPANTFVATAEAVVRAGGQPVVVDCDDAGLIDVAHVDAALARGARAVVPVHLYGQLADMDALAAVTAGRDVVVVEDAAQAQGATRHGGGIGTFGVAASTSFYPGKNLGAYGDAGAVLTSDDDVAARVRRLGDHGSESRYVHTDVGCNSRLDTLQAVVLRAKLRRLAAWNDERRSAAARYDALLAALADEHLVRLPVTRPGNVHVWHLYVIRVARRDDVVARLHEAGVHAGIHYPVPVHLQRAFAYLGHDVGSFPVAERAASEIVSLPIFPGISHDAQTRVVAALESAVAGERLVSLRC